MAVLTNEDTFCPPTPLGVAECTDSMARFDAMGLGVLGAGGLSGLCGLLGVRELFVPEALVDPELVPDLFGESAARLPAALLAEEAGEVPAVGLHEHGGGVYRKPPPGDGCRGLGRSTIHDSKTYCRVAALSSGRERGPCQVTELRPLAKGMATKKKPKPRISTLAPGWEGFGRRLRLAVEERCQQWGVAENEIARRSHLDSGAFSRAKKGRAGTGANTVMLLSRALYVRLVWLMDGTEPSGLEQFKQDPGPPDRADAETGT
jgi:hypothetical protein